MGHVVIQTKDLNRCIRFYKEVIGLKLVIQGDFFNAFEVGDVHFCVMPGDPESRVHFDFTSDEVDVLQSRLSKLGLECAEPKDDERSGHRYFSFKDPDGHEITVYSKHEPMEEVT